LCDDKGFAIPPMLPHKGVAVACDCLH